MVAGWVLGWVELYLNNSNAFNSSFLGVVGIGGFRQSNAYSSLLQYSREAAPDKEHLPTVAKQ